MRKSNASSQTNLLYSFFEKTITEKYWANELRNPVYISITSINGTELLS